MFRSIVSMTYLQLGEAATATQLADMRRKTLLVARGRGRAAHYSLPRVLSDRLRGRALTDADRPLENEGVRLRVLALLQERERLTNGQIREFSGYSRAQVHALMRQLTAEGLIEMRGVGNGSCPGSWPGPAGRRPVRSPGMT